MQKPLVDHHVPYVETHPNGYPHCVSQLYPNYIPVKSPVSMVILPNQHLQLWFQISIDFPNSQISISLEIHLCRMDIYFPFWDGHGPIFTHGVLSSGSGPCQHRHQATSQQSLRGAGNGQGLTWGWVQKKWWDNGILDDLDGELLSHYPNNIPTSYLAVSWNGGTPSHHLL